MPERPLNQATRSQTALDEGYMKRALALARRGLGATRPNPAVGAVIVKDRHIIGRGWHRFAGGAHAEVEALAEAGEAARGATLYVTLEPCNHIGRTPPCTEAVLRAGIARVVIAMSDPNPQVTGGGAERLHRGGIEVTTGVLSDAAHALNAEWLQRITTNERG